MKVLTIFFCLCLLVACKKTSTIKIIAENAVTGTRYAGLSYKVVSSKTTANGEKYQTEADGVLNENGEAMVDVKVKKGRSYSVRIGALENICYHNELDQYFESPYDLNGTFKYKFAECAYLKLKINNINCSGGGDNFKLYYMGRQVGGNEGLIGALSKNENGCYSYEGSNFSDVPMGGTYYRWEVTRNGLTQIFYDTIYLNSGEYKTYEINY